MKICEIEHKMFTLTGLDLLNFFFELDLLKRILYCGTCKFPMKLEKASKYVDGYAWAATPKCAPHIKAEFL